ncbi:unnamed protein product [Sphagnum jensenii]|uniref:DNA/RNA helicase protein n=2 Tax=Sphagnum jensenii TaxID=128206 RepID=A0ABP1AU90_9BRYO
MARQVSKQSIEEMRAVLGPEPSDMDLIRALHLSRNDVASAINILFDTPHFQSKSAKSTARAAPSIKAKGTPATKVHTEGNKSTPTLPNIRATHRASVALLDKEWVLLGETEIVAFSTCKGPKLQPGDPLEFSFPKQSVGSGKGPFEVRKPWGRSKGTAEIVRFSCGEWGEVGRIPGDWARSLIPLIQTGKVRVDGKCQCAPATLSLLDSIVVLLRVHLNRSLFINFNCGLKTPITASAEGTTTQPLPAIIRLLRREPFKKAAFTPEDLYTRKRSLDLQVGQGSGSEPLGAVLPAEKRLNLASKRVQGEENEEEGTAISDEDVNKLVGTSESCQLPEMEPPNALQCELRSYQKQALHWMTQLEIGLTREDAADTLHPCWEAYHLAEGSELAFYLNVFSGEATLDFPSALQTARGGILADAMGLGKTVMTISLILANPGRGGMDLPKVAKPSQEDPNSPSGLQLCLQEESSIQSTNQIKDSKRSRSSAQLGGGTLIVCPMTLLGQWKTEFETHVVGGLMSVYAYYGHDRLRERSALTDHDIVLTTYGVLASEWSQPNFLEEGPLHSIHWYRVVLDEAHTIKAFRSNASQAVFQLTADRRWCLTGTPIQNKLEDIFSLLHFLRVEPWSNYGWWNKLVQKPFEDGDVRGLKLLQAILRPLMLRRTKESCDKDGRPILVLPSADMQVVECELTEAEQDFYQALYKKSKVKFDKFVEQGKVLHNYASILELLLRLRQCCDHPFLVLSRGDTAEYADLGKLANRFLVGGKDGSAINRPTKAYVKEVVEDLKKGNKAECPICLEAAEDAVLTPCAHCMCRECLFASWQSYGGGLCPICRQSLSRQDIITAPSESRFQIDVEVNWTESSKVTALLQNLEALRASGSSKSIVFSQWTAFLDLLEIPLKRKKFQFVRLDGTLSQQQREKVLKQFSSNTSILVMLISLKAGGVGINLTAASNAFLLDPWWNPAVEEQAIMRIHRIGQTKAVSIKRFIVKGTVEERMQQVQARKQRMVAGALNNEEVRSARIEELKMLFR